MNIGKTGETGEKKVAAFLRKQGFLIVKRNYACKYGEIDIIAQNEEYILFVEVKTRKQGSLISGAQAVDAFKQQRIRLTAQDYILKTGCELQPRFDVAEVTIVDEVYKLRYIENAF